MAVKIIPVEPTVREMKKEAAECEHAAVIEPEPKASTLRVKAAVLREWITSLKTGRWTS